MQERGKKFSGFNSVSLSKFLPSRVDESVSRRKSFEIKRVQDTRKKTQAERVERLVLLGITKFQKVLVVPLSSKLFCGVHLGGNY
jgi:hypothetical protein